ncbi:hypothetical protein AAFF_G00354090 [Aldrovandia affinis]|uniref:Uncharacterized protein n=1 Tax=Aldrovandia affinis TaxID=143900 RepID=A0AAD7SJE6_9TELE|nr:hypothetical protein AAFF_G00354090 [Aldrovandia affinis]
MSSGNPGQRPHCGNMKACTPTFIRQSGSQLRGPGRLGAGRVLHFFQGLPIRPARNLVRCPDTSHRQIPSSKFRSSTRQQ